VLTPLALLVLLAASDAPYAPVRTVKSLTPSQNLPTAPYRKPGAPEKPAARVPRGFVLRLDAGGFLGAGWGTQIYRTQVMELKNQGITFWAQGTEPDSQLVVRSLPIAGPLVTLEYGGALARAEAAELVLTSALQAVGLAMLTYQAYTIGDPDEPPAAFELSLSPLVAGHLGISLTLLF
jgi:hypothetical protein